MARQAKRQQWQGNESLYRATLSPEVVNNLRRHKLRVEKYMREAVDKLTAMSTRGELQFMVQEMEEIQDLETRI